MKQFYKKGISLFLILLMSFPLCACKSDDSKALTTVKLNEVAHSIFYAPMYVAIEKGYFEDEGIELSLTTGFGADKTMAAVVSGDADVGFMGTEASIYAYTEGAKDHVINFAQLTQRAGNFVVARENTDSFSYEDMIGKDVLGGRAGGTPEMVYEYVLRENGVSPSEVKIDQSIDFGSTAAAFSGGQGDYTIEFEPSATALEQSGDGYVVASIGVDSGYLPYTAFCAKESYLKENADLIQHFANALQKGMDYVAGHSPEEIATVIAPQFSETDLKTLTLIVSRYYDQETWNTDLILREEGYDLMLTILEESGVLSGAAPYEDLVNTDFAEKASTP